MVRMLVLMLMLIIEGVRLKVSHLQHDLPQAQCNTSYTWQSQPLGRRHSLIPPYASCMHKYYVQAGTAAAVGSGL
jgi:hypothetical protein